MANHRDVSSWKCEKCGNEMYNEKNLQHHLLFCGITQPNFVCKLCDDAFYSPDELSSHLLICSRFICRYCNIPFIHTKALDYHIKNTHTKKKMEKNKISTYKCSICKEICESRRDLYYHRNNQHGGNDNLENIPPDILHSDNNELKRVYIANRDHILASDEEGELRKIYNFQSNNLHGGYREIRGHIQQIFNDQQNAFRINFAFGMILFNVETGEYRYYVPHFNSRILTYPFTISNRNSIRFFMHKITGIDVIQNARAVRPSTAWTLAFITNVQYNVFKTSFPFGNSPDMPDNVRRNAFLRTMYLNKRTGLPYTDKLCFFRCLKYHKKN